MTSLRGELLVRLMSPFRLFEFGSRAALAYLGRGRCVFLLPSNITVLLSGCITISFCRMMLARSPVQVRTDKEGITEGFRSSC